MSEVKYEAIIAAMSPLHQIFRRINLHKETKKPNKDSKRFSHFGRCQVKGMGILIV